MSKKSTNPIAKVFAFLGGFHIALICMVLLLLLTWLSTLEQQGPGGLYWTMDKYFSFDAVFVRPSYYGPPIALEWGDKVWSILAIGDKLPIILPGGYWVCAVFTLNLLVGGLFRIRKGWKYAPILVSHFSMMMLMVGGAVTYHQSREAFMLLNVGDTGDSAFSLTELSIEISEINEGEKQDPLVINSEVLSGLRGEPERERQFLLPSLPFDATVSEYQLHTQLTQKRGNLPDVAHVVDGFYALPLKPTGHEEKNLSACIITLKERASGKQHELLLFEGITHDVTVTIENKIYGLRLHGEIWNTPFRVHLDDSRGEKHPGTGMPLMFESDVTVLDANGNDERKFKIEMNKPLRYKDLTFYQTSWSDSGPKVESGFTVKTNPSDQWPKYAIYACGIALFVHFIIKLFGFVSASIARSKNEQ